MTVEVDYTVADWLGILTATISIIGACLILLIGFTAVRLLQHANAAAIDRREIYRELICIDDVDDEPDLSPLLGQVRDIEATLNDMELTLNMIAERLDPNPDTIEGSEAQATGNVAPHSMTDLATAQVI